MPRIARLTYPGGFYHVFNRGHNKGNIFYEDSDYEKLLEKLAVLLKEGDWSIYSYCLMPNHYHFLIEEKKYPVAKLIGRLFTSYSKYFNNKYQRQGSLFQDRFKSKIIQKESYFMTVSRYIHLNPFKSGIIKNPEEYLYSSLYEYSGKKTRKIIDFNKVSNLIGNNNKTINEYLKFIRDGMNVNLDDYDPFEDNKEVIGSTVFSSHRKMKAYRA